MQEVVVLVWVVLSLWGFAVVFFPGAVVKARAKNVEIPCHLGVCYLD